MTVAMNKVALFDGDDVSNTDVAWEGEWETRVYIFSKHFCTNILGEPRMT